MRTVQPKWGGPSNPAPAVAFADGSCSFGQDKLKKKDVLSTHVVKNAVL